jgi:uncharacterized protein YecE (DUF72 family)
MKFGAGIFEKKSLDFFTKGPYFEKKSPSQVMIGMPQWSIPAWKNHFYSHDCRNQDFLEQYAKRLPCCEVSSTFYAPVSKERWSSWQEQAGKEFHFLPKWPKIISHDKALRSCKHDVEEFAKRLEALENNLGTTLLQLGPSFSYDYRADLFKFLTSLPSELPLAIEFRHTSWFQDQRLLPKLEDYLYQNNISTVCTDTSARRDVCHLSFTGERNIIRYLSDGNEENDILRLKSWKDWLQKHPIGGTLYFMLHRPDNTKTYDLIEVLDPNLSHHINELNQGPQTDLFL